MAVATGIGGVLKPGTGIPILNPGGNGNNPGGGGPARGRAE